VTESQAAVSGGVTTMLTYFRTGQYYLNRGGAYADFFPEVLAHSQGHYHCDYAYHLAPIAASHVGEMEMLALRHGVPSFKIFMFS
jgi:allantoinase